MKDWIIGIALLTLVFGLIALFPCAGQTVSTTPAKATTGTGTPTQNVVITVNGKKISFLLSPANIPPLQVNVPSLTGTVSLKGLTGTGNCSLAPGGQIIIHPDQTITVTGLKCSITQAP